MLTYLSTHSFGRNNWWFIFNMISISSICINNNNNNLLMLLFVIIIITCIYFPIINPINLWPLDLSSHCMYTPSWMQAFHFSFTALSYEIHCNFIYIHLEQVSSLLFHLILWAWLQPCSVLCNMRIFRLLPN